MNADFFRPDGDPGSSTVSVRANEARHHRDRRLVDTVQHLIEHGHRRPTSSTFPWRRCAVYRRDGARTDAAPGDARLLSSFVAIGTRGDARHLDQTPTGRPLTMRISVRIGSKGGAGASCAAGAGVPRQGQEGGVSRRLPARPSELKQDVRATSRARWRWSRSPSSKGLHRQGARQRPEPAALRSTSARASRGRASTSRRPDSPVGC